MLVAKVRELERQPPQRRPQPPRLHLPADRDVAGAQRGDGVVGRLVFSGDGGPQEAGEEAESSFARRAEQIRLIKQIRESYDPTATSSSPGDVSRILGRLVANNYLPFLEFARLLDVHLGRAFRGRRGENNVGDDDDRIYAVAK